MAIKFKWYFLNSKIKNNQLKSILTFNEYQKIKNIKLFFNNLNLLIKYVGYWIKEIKID